MEEILGKTFVSNDGPVGTEKLAGAQVIGIYFSAHWCPPCIMPRREQY